MSHGTIHDCARSGLVLNDRYQTCVLLVWYRSGEKDTVAQREKILYDLVTALNVEGLIL